MAHKIGTIRYTASVSTSGRIEYDEWIVRTIRGRFTYLIFKIDSVTWGKRTKRHGDYGWLPQIPHWCRIRCPRNGDLPFSASKKGALRQLISEIRINIGYLGEDGKDCEEELTLGDQLKFALRAQKRLKN